MSQGPEREITPKEALHQAFAPLVDEITTYDHGSILLDADHVKELVGQLDETLIFEQIKPADRRYTKYQTQPQIDFSTHGKNLPTMNITDTISLEREIGIITTGGTMLTDSSLINGEPGRIAHRRPMRIRYAGLDDKWKLKARGADKNARETFGKDPDTDVARAVYNNLAAHGVIAEPNEIKLDIVDNRLKIEL